MRSQRVSKTRSCRPLLKCALWVCGLGSLGAVALSPLVGQGMLQSSSPHLPPELNRIPDANRINHINESQPQQAHFEAVNAERKKQMAEDASKLLELAADLKSELDTTNKDTLSLNVIRKADEIEKLAHTVKQKMKLAAGSM